MEGCDKVMAFAPVYTEHSHILIVGTWPSPKSRAQSFYYGHPQNRFWPLIARLLGRQTPADIPDKVALIQKNGLALWDVIEHCTITGASDASIREVTPTDIAGLCRCAPIRLVLCNGVTAYRLCEKYQRLPAGVQAVQLPSTSPANAACNMQALVAAWGKWIGPEHAGDQ